MLRYLGTTKVLLFMALLLVSATTLVQFFVDDENRTLYGVATSLSHIGLVLLGSVYTRSYINNKNRSST